MAFEGNEVEKKVGAGGLAIVDVSSSGIARAEINYAEGALKGGAYVEIDVVQALEQLAAKTDNKVDDAMVAMIKGALGR